MHYLVSSSRYSGIQYSLFASALPIETNVFYITHLNLAKENEPHKLKKNSRL